MGMRSKILYTLAVKVSTLNEELFICERNDSAYTKELSKAVFVESQRELPVIDMKHYCVTVEKKHNRFSVLKKDVVFKKVKRTRSLLSIW
ncbi:hypothetical protein ACFC4S_26620 [Priestia megaterium]|uniref:hypothetical protein n=1 Tax=Priestia megaterium TaxID=1404 RepID=UPI001E05B83A|nr:hypothetical protein [Priestia megaterium]